MKIITKNTLLRCGDKTYPPIEVKGVIYWEKSHVKQGDYVFSHITKEIMQTNQATCIWFNNKIVAQLQPILEGVPVISLDSYVEKLKKEYNTGENTDVFTKGVEVGIEIGYKSNPNQYTQKDIGKAIELARDIIDGKDKLDLESIIGLTEICTHNWEVKNVDKIFEQINSISVIEVDEQFNIISYE
jgi:hypothetical protein